MNGKSSTNQASCVLADVVCVLYANQWVDSGGSRSGHMITSLECGGIVFFFGVVLAVWVWYHCLGPTTSGTLDPFCREGNNFLRVVLRKIRLPID